jgi:hypothetical protein
MKRAENKQYDLCIIGSGPAGIILALEFARMEKEKNILLVEYGAGKKKTNDLDDSIRIKDLLNHHSPYECTNKTFGGTSLTWGGRCVTYEEIDFLDRPVLNGHCTWDKELFFEVNNFLSTAADYFECGTPVFDLKNMEKSYTSSIAEGFTSGVVTDNMVERWSPPTRFGNRYKELIKKTKNITLIEGWEARDFGYPDEAGKVSTLLLRNNEGGLDEIKAEKFVIAAGAQESTRLLLKNLQVFQNLEKVPPALGSYYQGHLSGKISSVVFNGDPAKTDFGFLKDEDGVYLRRRFQFDKDFLLENDLLNTAIWLDNPLYHKADHRNGSMSIMYLLMILPVLGKKLAPPAIKESITKGRVEDIGAHIWNVIRDLPQSLLTPAEIFYKRYLLKRKLPGVFLYNKTNTYSLHFHSEQIPVITNRMKLAEDGETLEIEYALCDREIDSVIALHKELDQHLRTNSCGKLVYWYKEDQLRSNIRKMSKDGLHQVGTIRIADGPEKGVVDRNLKVFGCENLYVCSSAVFPTSSQANPTFYIGAFAGRLAQYLRGN